jgi:hypothetical protein
MRNVTVRTQLDIQLTAEDWQLYNVTGRDHAAFTLNRGIEQALNLAENSEQGYTNAHAVMCRFAKWGATDTEPMAVFRRLYALRFPVLERVA